MEGGGGEGRWVGGVDGARELEAEGKWWAVEEGVILVLSSGLRG